MDSNSFAEVTECVVLLAPSKILFLPEPKLFPFSSALGVFPELLE